MSEPDTSTYPAPIHGWCCFHCGENFTTVGAARDHFGGNIYDTPGCMIRVQVGEERGLLMELRQTQAERDKLRADIEGETSSWQAFTLKLDGQLAQYKVFARCRTIQDVFNLYDSMEGRALAAEESVATLTAAHDKLARELAETRAQNELLMHDGFAAVHHAEAEYRALKQQLSLYRWRPVSEGLPPPHEEVLAVYDDGECHVLAYSKDHARWYRQMDGASLWADPTHWMPLPAAPHEGEQD